MNFYDVINNRRTIRDLQDKAIPDEVLNRILTAGLKAPTNDHMRSWEYVILKDAEEKAKVIDKIPKKFTRKQVEGFLDQNQLTDACQRDMYLDGVPKQYTMLYHSGCLVLPFFRQDYPILNPKSMSDLNNLGSIWCCIENIFLAATAEGLATAFRIPFPNEVKYIKEAIGHPDNYYMPCYIAIGYPSEDATHPKQYEFNAEDKIHMNKW